MQCTRMADLRSRKRLLPIATLTGLVVAVMLTGACSGRTETPVAAYSSIFAYRWYEGLGQIIEDERVDPPQAARIYAYTGVALYESLVRGMAGYTSLEGQLNGFGELNDLGEVPEPIKGAEYHWPTVANAAIGEVLRGLFSTASVEALRDIAELRREGDDLFEGTFIANDPATQDDEEEQIITRSRAFGSAMGNFVYQWSLGDGYTTLRDCDYPVPSGSGLWEPTLPAFAEALEPCWGRMRPFVLDSADEFLPQPPTPYSAATGSAMHDIAKDVYDTRNGLTDDQRELALYWADVTGESPTPAGHSLAVVSQVLFDVEYRLDVAAEAYVKVGLAVADAYISTWNTRYRYNMLRPITYVNKNIDPDWSPLINTPAFPEYTSDHAAQAGAASVAMTSVFGARPFYDEVYEDRDLDPRPFVNFDGWAEEAALSRLYAGIHYRPSTEAGLAEGRAVGNKVLSLKFLD